MALIKRVYTKAVIETIAEITYVRRVGRVNSGKICSGTAIPMKSVPGKSISVLPNKCSYPGKWVYSVAKKYEFRCGIKVKRLRRRAERSSRCVKRGGSFSRAAKKGKKRLLPPKIIKNRGVWNPGCLKNIPYILLLKLFPLFCPNFDNLQKTIS